MADFLISSLRGGMNNSDPPSALPNDQCVLQQNTELYRSMLGERRQGTEATDLTGSDLEACDRIVWMHRHLPTDDESESQLWVMGIIDGVSPSAVLAYKDTSWHTVAMADALVINGVSEYQIQGQTLHGNLFVAYHSDQDRLHVWDGTSFRRTGLRVPPAAPTGADTGSGLFTGTRYYRVRHLHMSGTTVVRRSEASEVLTFAPSGTGLAARVSEPAGTNEGETHWELEASTDNANFYRIATSTVATTFYDDSQDYVTGYAAFPLSEDAEDYSLIPSGRYLTADEDRLLIGGSWMDSALASRVMWTPVLNDPGDGNDERLQLDTDPYRDLDGFEGGPLTGLSSPAAGSVWAVKQSHIYKLVRSGLRSRAYDSITYSKERGAVRGSMFTGVDQSGRPAVYLLDPAVGPSRLAAKGLEQCGADIRETWLTVNLDAANAVCSGLFYPETRQAIWNIATGDSDTPNVGIVLQTNETRDMDDGARKGWSIWTGDRVKALAMCLYAENIDDDTARSLVLRPFIALEGLGLIHRCDTGDDDNGVAYAARIVSRPYIHGNILHQFGAMNGALIAKAVAGAVIDVKLIRDFGLQTVTVANVTFDPTADETQVIKSLGDLGQNELRAMQIEFVDPATPGTRWELNNFAVKETSGQTS